MSINSADNHWMYISSTGCLTAGREQAKYALFPYVTDDLLHQNARSTGPSTHILVEQNNKKHLWQPFSDQIESYKKEQNLFKNSLGNKIVFEEVNHSLGLTFLYSWQASSKYGFVKKTKLINHSKEKLNIKLIDGLRNILPAGLELRTQQEMSNLANAYKVSECNPDYNYALYYMNALLMDKPDPGESLFSNMVWSFSEEKFELSVNQKSIHTFLNNHCFTSDLFLKGKEGSFLDFIEKTLDHGHEICWYIVADVQKSQSDIIEIISDLKEHRTLKDKLEESILDSHYEFEKNIGMADGFQCTNNGMNDLHHTANVTYNVLRGGIFSDNYNIQKTSLVSFLKVRNKNIFETYNDDISKLPDTFSIEDLKEFSDRSNDPTLRRICREYLPLTLGRRHGDPSRPWNHFNIITKDSNNQPVLYYEGNWRDIFQNWEALGLSYPYSWESMICIFLNATTADGYNPYRITSHGIDWEIIEPDDSWSHIGYWNDHQIIYLLKLLEHQKNNDPKKLEQLFTEQIFSYANVPYRIRSFDEIIKNPKETIDFDFDAHTAIMDLDDELGSDGRLILNDDKTVYHVTFCEKILVLALAKICNYVPGAGIWLNTQRPEWNDANNALVGNGTSMVTVYYLKRFLKLFKNLIMSLEVDHVDVSVEVLSWFNEVENAVQENKGTSHTGISENDRMAYVSRLGKIYEDYRSEIYSEGFSIFEKLSLERLEHFISLISNQFDETILDNRRKDGLFDAYNTININLQNQSMDVKKLDLMLEGQVAGLSYESEHLSDNIQTLQSLYSSSLYRSDMRSFILYPVKDIVPFLKKNIINPQDLQKSTLLVQMVDLKITSIVQQDSEGNFRFNPNFRNINDLYGVVKNLPESKFENVSIKEELKIISEVFELVFDHRNFTGRSGTMFSYEGIGSIYWHMISKLLLATQENYFLAKNNKSLDSKIAREFENYYFKIRSGLSASKTPKAYGAFPFDPYSHTPSHSGAQQPGMTGQVKEEILTRFGELGCVVKDGCIIFDTSLLQKSEFLSNEKVFSYFDILKEKCLIEISQDQLAYTFCQVPIVYTLSQLSSSVTLFLKDDTKVTMKGNTIDKKNSKYIFDRAGMIKKIEYSINNNKID